MLRTTIKTILLPKILLGCLSVTSNNFGMEQTPQQLQFYISALKCPFDIQDSVYKITDNDIAHKPYYISNSFHNNNFTRTIMDNSTPINIQQNEYNLSQEKLSRLAYYQEKGRKLFIHKASDNKQLICPIQKIIMEFETT